MKAGLIIVCAGVVATAAAADARMLDLAKPEDVIRAEIRLNCATDPAKPRIGWMRGRIMARRQGEPDVHLFDVQAVNTRACQIFDDPARGPGYRAVNREILVYIDPATGEILDRWANPWTGETVDVITMYNDPVNMREPKYARDAGGRPTAKWEGQIVGSMAVTLNARNHFRDGPMSGDYQDYVGGKYSVLESSSMIVPVAAWLDTEAPLPVPAVSSWTRISPWLPWMKMAGREGYTVLVSNWFTATSLDEVDEPLRSAIRTRHPEYAVAPPLDDTRPAINSWDAMKKAIDAKRATAK
ncbi:MAG: DUF1838 family protein [Rhodospirillaceae bacterium]|nr:DUF1838 family protein [Rhodospirillaceae bacterium]